MGLMAARMRALQGEVLVMVEAVREQRVVGGHGDLEGFDELLQPFDALEDLLEGGLAAVVGFDRAAGAAALDSQVLLPVPGQLAQGTVEALQAFVEGPADGLHQIVPGEFGLYFDGFGFG